MLPDVMGDGEGTRQALQKDAENWINAITCDGFMIVLQGKDDEDFDKTLKFVLDHKDEGVWKFVSWLSVPRKRVEAAGSRGDDIAKVLGTTEEF
ncbi:hypothetical protein VJI94_08160, partial [Parvimonas sp. D9]|nr:hypothetical protein [Parvimonas sp. D9]